jgi:hypothetical protein
MTKLHVGTLLRLGGTIAVVLALTGCRSSVVAGGAPPVGGAWISVDEYAVTDGPVAKLRLDILAEGYSLSGTWTLGPLGGSLEGGSSESSNGVTLFLNQASGGEQIVFRGSVDSSVTLLQGALDGSSSATGGTESITFDDEPAAFVR